MSTKKRTTSPSSESISIIGDDHFHGVGDDAIEKCKEYINVSSIILVFIVHLADVFILY